jgi:hypothetical protein
MHKIWLKCIFIENDRKRYFEEKLIIATIAKKYFYKNLKFKLSTVLKLNNVLSN